MSRKPDGAKTARQAIDPVCKMVIMVDRSTLKIDHGEHAHYFCSELCMKVFEKDPKKYH
jgi:carbonic anhydrase